MLGVLITAGAWFVAPTSNVPLPWFVALASVAVLVVMTLGEAARRALRFAARPLPNIRLAVDEVASGGGLVLVLDESSHFSTGIAVTLFIVVHGDYEARLGTGYVETIREDGRIQVRIVNLGSGHLEELQKVRLNDASVLKNLRVKPSLVWTPFFSDGAIR